MTDLRQAAQQALEAFDSMTGRKPERVEQVITALREALEQPEQEPTPWRDMVVVSLVRDGINKHKARELADHFAAQRPWQGLTEDEQLELYKKYEMDGWGLFYDAIEAALRSKNT